MIVSETSTKGPTGYCVTGRSTELIRNYTQMIRDKFGLHKPYVDIVEFYDFLVANDFFESEILEAKDFPRDELGQTSLYRYSDGSYFPVIRLKEEVYEGAADGNGHHRFTIAHELGHVMLHIDDLKLTRSTSHRANKEYYRDSEWQANTFAAQLLADERFLHSHDNPHSIANRFGLSLFSATLRNKSRIRRL